MTLVECIAMVAFVELFALVLWGLFRWLALFLLFKAFVGFLDDCFQMFSYGMFWTAIIFGIAKVIGL